MKNASAMLLRRRCALGFVGLGSFLCSASARADPDEPRRADANVVVTTSVVTPLFGAYYLESNIRIARRWGLLVNASRLTLADDDWTSTANTVGAGLSYYFQGEALRQWYVEAIGELLRNSRRHEPSGKTSAAAFGSTAVLVVGYAFVHELGPVLDVGAGAAVVRVPGGSVDTGTGEVSIGAKTLVYPALKVDVGWAF